MSKRERNLEASASSSNETDTKKAKLVPEEQKQALLDNVNRTLKATTLRTCESFEDLLNKVKGFKKEYDNLILENESEFVKKKVEKFLKDSEDKFAHVKDSVSNDPISIAVVGSTGVGKSYIVNSLAMLEEESSLFDIGLVKHSKKNVFEDSAAVTLFPSRIMYGEKVELQVTYEATKSQDNNSLFEIEGKEDAAAKSWDDSQEISSYEIEGLDLTSKLLNLNQRMDELTREHKEKPIDHVVLKVPFKTLKELNICLLDIPGLSDDDDNIVNRGLRLAKTAQILFLVLENDKRGHIEHTTLNIIEDLYNVCPSKIPYLVVVDNCSKNDTNNTRDQIRNEMIYKLHQFRNNGNKYFRSIEGDHRIQIFQKLMLHCDGFAFYGRKMLIQEQMECLQKIIQQVREYEIDKALSLPFRNISIAAYEILLDLTNKKRFKEIQFNEISEKSFEEFKEKNKQSWKDACLEVFCGDNEQQLRNEKPGRIYKKAIVKYFSKNYFDLFIHRRLEIATSILLNLFLEIACQVMPLQTVTYSEELFYDLYTKISSHDEELLYSTDFISPIENDINRVYRLASDLSSKNSKKVDQTEKELDILTSIFDECYQKITNQCGEYIEFLNKQLDHFYGIIEKGMKKRKEISFDSFLAVVMNDLPALLNNGRSEDKKIYDILVSNQSLLDLLIQISKSFEKKSDNCQQKKKKSGSSKNTKKTKSHKESTPKELKRQITRFFNNSKQNSKDNQEENEIPMTHLLPTEWKLFSVTTPATSDKDNKATKTSHKRSSISAKTEPKEPPSSVMKNFPEDVSTIVTYEDISTVDRKTIKISHRTNKLNMFDGFKISFYKDWKQDVKSLLSNNNALFPIFVPSKKRHNLTTKATLYEQFTNYDYLMFVVVEEQEMLDYEKILADRSDKIVFVEIPGKDRGIGFARSCIKLLQEIMRLELLNRKEIKERFDFYWTLDDDIINMYQFDSTCNGRTKVKTSMGFVLFTCQQVLKDIIAKSENRYQKTPSILHEEIEDVIGKHSIAKAGRFWSWVAEKTEKFFKYIDYNNQAKFNDKMKTFGVKDLDQFFKDLKDISNKLKQEVICVSRMSIANTSTKTNYNLKGSDMHYRVSSQIHATILNYAPGLQGYNFLPLKYMLLSQEEVDKEKFLFKKEEKQKREERRKKVKQYLKELTNKDALASEEQRKNFQEYLCNLDTMKDNDTVPCYYLYRDFFDGEDKIFSTILELDNRFGYQMYFFEVRYGAQKKGVFR